MLGICALCEKNADIKNSHLIPKWAYRRVLGTDSDGMQAPVVVAEGAAVLSNKQTTKYLLCAECEQRFSTREDYLAQLTELNSGRIRLYDYVTKLGMPNGILASLSSEVDAEQITYFVASLMWRSCVMTGGCKLGVYEPKFKQYLLGNGPFPHEAIITIGLVEESSKCNAKGWVSEPASQKIGILWLHGFLLDGLVFRCLVGKTIDQRLRQISITGPNFPKYVAIVKPETCNDFLAAIDMVGTAKSRGKLAKLF